MKSRTGLRLTFKELVDALWTSSRPDRTHTQEAGRVRPVAGVPGSFSKKRGQR